MRIKWPNMYKMFKWWLVHSQHSVRVSYHYYIKWVQIHFYLGIISDFEDFSTRSMQEKKQERLYLPFGSCNNLFSGDQTPPI